MARYAMESSKQLAAGIIILVDKGYTTLSKYHPDLLSDTPNSPGPSNSSWKGGRLAASEVENAGIVSSVCCKLYKTARKWLPFLHL